MDKNILVIEDDKDIREGIKILLEGEGYVIEEASNGMEGLEKLNPKTNLVILDIMMPGISGLKICEEIRKISYVPILFLTAKSKESDKLIGFMAGADDYLVKPFSHTELFVRVRALLRRQQIYDKGTVQAAQEEEWIEMHQIRINTSKNIVFLKGDELCLTEIEYKILLLLMRYPAKTFSLQNLYESIWEQSFISSSANTVMVHVRNLRTKIEENSQKPKIIVTVWGKGYRLG